MIFGLLGQRSSSSTATGSERRSVSPSYGQTENFLAFIIPCLLFVEVELIGRLFLSEILVAAILPFLVLRRGSALLSPLPRTLILLGLVWLSSQILTDLIRGTPFVDYARGWAKITFVLINFVVLYLLVSRRPRRILWFGSGLATGMILAFFLNPNIYAEGNPWKFGVGPAITLLLLLSTQVSFPRKSPLLQVVIVTFAGMLNLVLDFRSQAAILFLTAAYLVGQQITRGETRRPWGGYTVLLVVITLIAGWLTFSLYGFAVQQGWLGETAFQKYEQQSAGTLGIFLGGRAEFLASAQAILDSPLLGHGSWAKDPRYTLLLAERLEEFGYTFSGQAEDALIPTHSHLFGAWVEAGAGGTLIWIWVLALVAKSLLNLFRAGHVASPLIGYLAFTLVWNILFSPLGAETRLITAFYIAAVMTAELMVKACQYSLPKR